MLRLGTVERGFSPSLLSFQCLWLMWSSLMTQLLLLAGLTVANLGPVQGEGGNQGVGEKSVWYGESRKVPPTAGCDVSELQRGSRLSFPVGGLCCMQ